MRAKPQPDASPAGRHAHRWAAIVALGVGLRLVLLLWSGDIPPYADEGQYLYQGVAWAHFGFYLGSPGWLWPPGYPGLLALSLEAFGPDGPRAAKLAQVLLSSATGFAVILMAQRLFSVRAATVAGLFWAFHLPLAAYTHYLWPESILNALLLPAVYLFLTVVDPRGPAAGAPWRLAAAGGLLGCVLMFKEAPLPLLVFLPAILLLSPSAGRLPERVAGAVILVLGAAVVVFPWTLRNVEVYGRWMPTGSTLGANVYQGVNSRYLNYDYGGWGDLAPRLTPARLRPGSILEQSPAYRWLAAPPDDAPTWEPSTAPNLADITSENLARAFEYVAAEPGFYCRTRLKKLADWVAPLSFFVRHQRIGLYSGSLNAPGVRGPLVLFSVASSVVLLLAGTAGLFLALPHGPTRWTFLAILITFLAVVVVGVSMSRYRVAVEPFLVVAGAGLLARPVARPVDRVLAGCAVAGLLLLWLLNAPEVTGVLRSLL